MAAVGSAFCWPAMSGALPCTGSNMLGAVPSGLMLPLAEADSAGHRGAEVGEDVAEEVVGDDDIEPFGLGDEEHRRGVDVAVVNRHAGELLGKPVHGPLPQV